MISPSSARFPTDLLALLRSLRRTPVVAVVAVLSLALGFGTNTAFFTYFRSLFLEPPLLAEPSRLVWLQTVVEDDPDAPLWKMSRPNYDDYTRSSGEAFSGLLAYRVVAAHLGFEDMAPMRAFGQIASESYFEVLGIGAALGRTFRPGEAGAAGTHPVVLSHDLWKRFFNADRAIVGKTVRLNRHPFEVIGVTGEGFKGTRPLGYSDFWVPMSAYPQILTDANSGWFDRRGALALDVIGRLREGVEIEQAQSVLDRTAAALREQYPVENEGIGVALLPYVEGAINPNFRRTLLLGFQLLMLVMGLLLLIATANIASLLLTRALARRQEIALRLALGARRWHLARQLLQESALLSLTGLAVSLLVATWTRRLLWSYRPPYVDELVEFHADTMVMAFGLGLAVLTTLLCGLAPAVVTLDTGHLARALNPRGQTAVTTGSRVDPRSSIVAVQVALCFVALIGSGLLLRSLGRLQDIDPGFRHRDVVHVGFDLDTAGYDQARGRAFQRGLLEWATSLPGVRRASLAEYPVPVEANPIFGLRLLDRETPAELTHLLIGVNAVGPGYFETQGIPLAEGRSFDSRDRSGGPDRAIINQALSELLWPGESPLGRRFELARVPVEVVGVAKTVKYNSMTEEPQPFAYRPLDQAYTPRFHLLLSGGGDPAALVQAVRGQARRLDPTVPLVEVRTTRELIASTLWGPRIGAALLTLVSALAFVLAAIGVYGATSYAVTARRREIAIRLALGGRPLSVIALVVRRGLMPVAAGLLAGGVALFVLGPAVSKLLFGIAPHDPGTLVGAFLLLGAMALVASYLSTRRVASLDPMTVLRDE